MKPVWRIACLTLLNTPGAQTMRASLPQCDVEWDVIPIRPELDRLKQEMTVLASNYDAVAIEGLTSTFEIAGRRYRHEYVWNALQFKELRGRLSDGSALLSTLERHLVRQAAEGLKPLINGKRILFFSGLKRYGTAEVLNSYSSKLIFGDLLYGFRLGIPILSLSALAASAPQLAMAISPTPANWYWAPARRGRMMMPRFHYFFRTADVIIGDIPYFQRYAPPHLTGKVIFTNIMRPADLELFRERGVRLVVSLTPDIGGVPVPLPVLQAVLLLDAGAADKPPEEHNFLNQIQALDLKPRLYDLLVEEEDVVLNMPALPVKSAEPLVAQSARELDLAPGDTVGKFVFVIHPLTFNFVKRLPAVKMLSKVLPERWIEDTVAQMTPFPVGAIHNISSEVGAKAEGVLYVVPMTSKSIMRNKPEFLYRKLERVANDAAKLGCRLMGLGAYTSVAGDAGVTVSERVNIGVTSGNSYTVAVTLRSLRETAERCGINLARAKALVIGATGSIGSICTRLLARDVAEIAMVGPRAERLLALSSLIGRETPGAHSRIHLSRSAADYLGWADVIITTTSAVDPVIDVSALKPGCVVCDVARPPDIKEEAAAKRDDILVIESGEVMLPEGTDLTYDIGLPPGTMYACLAETALLALDGRFGDFTLGREIEPEKVRLIDAIGLKHGFKLAPARSFGVVVREERYERLRNLNEPRFMAELAGSQYGA